MQKVVLVLQRGWVVVGDLGQDDGVKVQLTNASVIRRWGTTKGLGEIALKGPTMKTILDACGVVEAHPAAVVLRVPCDASAWAGK